MAIRVEEFMTRIEKSDGAHLIRDESLTYTGTQIEAAKWPSSSGREYAEMETGNFGRRYNCRICSEIGARDSESLTSWGLQRSLRG